MQLIALRMEFGASCGRHDAEGFETKDSNGLLSGYISSCVDNNKMFLKVTNFDLTFNPSTIKQGVKAGFLKFQRIFGKKLIKIKVLQFPFILFVIHFPF
jgi:hypothetical protein